jgi:hypothetical protein
MRVGQCAPGPGQLAERSVGGRQLGDQLPVKPQLGRQWRWDEGEVALKRAHHVGSLVRPELLSAH